MRLARMLVALATAGCCDPVAIIDSFPVPIDLDGGVPIVGARASELMGGALRAVIDTSAPVTVVDEGAGGTTRRRLGLELLRSSGAARARFECVPALIAGVGAVGAGTPDDVGGVIGGDVLSRVAMRIDASKRELHFFPDIAGSDATHENDCTPVMRVTLAGGGSFVAGSDTVDFAPSRVVLGACLAPPVEVTEDGVDSLLVVATGVAPTVLSRTVAGRALGLDDAAIDALPEVKLYLPGDAQAFGETARAARLPRLALTGRVTGRGPCRELFRSRSIAAAPLDQVTAGQWCQNGTCAAATVELPGQIDVAIVPDSHPLLQALRNELRPEVADVGGLLGMAALAGVVIDLDYPGSRVLIRCADGATGCVARPRIGGSDRAEELRNVHRCFAQ